MTDFIGLAAFAGAFVLLAESAHRKKKLRKVLLFGFVGALAFGLGHHALTTASIVGGSAGLLVKLGLAMLAGAAVLEVRESKPKVLLLPAVLALLLGGAIFLSSFLIGGAVSFAKGRLQKTIPGQCLLELGPDDSINEKPIQDVLRKYKVKAERAFPSVTLEESVDLAQTYLLSGPADSLEALMTELRADTENVDHVEPNFAVNVSDPALAERPEVDKEGLLANDPHLGEQWGFELTEGDRVHRLLKNRKPRRKAIVAIVDTGVDGRHEDITSVFGESPGASDGHGHGTHCAGIAGAATNNGLGIASYNWEGRFVTVRGYKALSDSGGGSAESVSQAIIAAAKGRADVISLSLGGYAPTPPRAEVLAVEFAIKKGCIVVCAAGNSAEDAKLHAPANIPGVIVVSALDQGMRKANFSNTNTSLGLPIAAPGVDIFSLKPGTGYVGMSGTSMATPMVSGLIGVIRSFNPKITTEEVHQLLVETGTQGQDADSVGASINAGTAVEAAASKSARR